jgi:DNA (cytosine-5)-methyltransferase 1
LRFPGKPLSARATRGFLSRTERSSLRFVPGFIERLRRHLQRVEKGSAAFASDFEIAAVAAE